MLYLQFLNYLFGNSKGVNMPKGKGTYSKPGRPKKKRSIKKSVKKKMSKKKMGKRKKY